MPMDLYRSGDHYDVVAEAFQGVSVQVHRRGDPPAPGARLQDSGERLQNLVRWAFHIGEENSEVFVVGRGDQFADEIHSARKADLR